jgi:ferredoxin--NADP+ reductase
MVNPTQIVRSGMIDGRVSSNTALTGRLHALRIEVALSPFEAGQFVRLELQLDGVKVARPYSLVNAPSDSVAEVFFNTVTGGQLSNALAHLRKGDAVAVSQPATGFFTLHDTPPAKALWMIATGTGLGPYLSILRTPQLWERYEQVVLAHGVPLCEELVYQDVIREIRNIRAERFVFIACVSREDNPHGFRGRVTEAFSSGALERQVGRTITPTDSSVMLCGNHNMINDMQALLKARGLRKHLRHKPGQIVTEQYF